MTRRRLTPANRLSGALLAGLLLAVLAAAFLRGAGGGSTPAADGSPGERTSQPPARTTPAEAWLAWVPGGFPKGFRDQIAGEPGLDEVVVFAGNTRWMTASRDADGQTVDRPEPPYKIPIDAFAVAPEDYEPFVPQDIREDVVTALRNGRAVLGSSSAELRRLGPGGTLAFGDEEVVVGAVAPDPVVGWAEMLVSRETGARLGIVTDRYMLATGNLTAGRFEKIVREHLPAESYLRIEEPGGTTYMRVASRVNPPVVMKQVFGEFSAYPRSDDPAFLNMSPEWYEANIQTRRVPILGEVTCNVALFPALVGALQELVDRGLDHLIHIYSGCYAARTVARSDTAPPSQHAYGAAIDIDAPTNGFGDTTPAMDMRVVRVFERWGFIWGGDFLITDGMHFEYGGAAAAA